MNEIEKLPVLKGGVVVDDCSARIILK
jgi:hypothetical protein